MEFYHLLNRGVDKRKVFSDTQDYLRFIRNLYVLNTSSEYVHNEWTLEARLQSEIPDKLVHIHAFCLMPNHYHLLVSPIANNSIPLFMKKVNMGYSKYFNERYERSGALWQGKYKQILIREDAHFLFIPYYIHLNPLDLSAKSWRKGCVKNATDALAKLDTYRWSSHGDYTGINRYGYLLQQDILSKMFGTKREYFAQINKIISGGASQVDSALIE